MAVWVYKANESGEVESELIAAQHLDAQLQGGWTVNESGKTEEAEEAEEEKSIDDLSNEDIRALAMEAGIESYETKRIDTLKKELMSNDN